ncbi:thioredoxin family protein [Paenibacillus sp. OAS669]|uniref:thioredoxin family protein n=1 Tax=Paenibacillus sp. OAS669 TaxID=2663821 RepID=UPI00178ABFAF|nr:thioredoxin family protein [Paenibacillus sp. OAS669]MBE1445618.1 thioredoxin 1 [Paenibacillus sp. OAS669]
MSIPRVNTTTFRNAIKEKEVTLVDFSAQWCPPCKVLLPILEELQHEEGSRLSILQIDCDESPEIAAEFGVMSMPTVIVFHNGEPVDKFIGLRPKGVYQAALSRYA